jgi:hypothetical protein
MLEKQSETLFKPTSTVAQPIETNGKTPSREMADISAAEEAARCLQGYAADHGDDSKAFQLLAALASEVLNGAGKLRPSEIETIGLYMTHRETKFPKESLEPGKATRWVSEAWNGWLKKRDERLSGLREYAAQHGLAFYPWPEKIGDGKGGSGRTSIYTIEARPLLLPPSKTSTTADTVIHYIRETTPKPAWWASWFGNPPIFSIRQKWS